MTFGKSAIALAIFGLMAGCGTQATLSDGAPTLTISINVDTLWLDAAVESQLEKASRRYAECGIELAFGPAKGADTHAPDINFVASLPTANDNTVEGRAYKVNGRYTIEIAWSDASGDPLDHKQTLAHELGHVLGLGHTPLHSINLMAPHGCALCRFTPRQCQRLRSAVKRF